MSNRLANNFQFIDVGRNDPDKRPLRSRKTEYKEIYKQRTATERINAQATALGIERPRLRNGAAIANLNTLIYVLINLRALQRVLEHKRELSS